MFELKKEVKTRLDFEFVDTKTGNEIEVVLIDSKYLEFKEKTQKANMYYRSQNPSAGYFYLLEKFIQYAKDSNIYYQFKLEVILNEISNRQGKGV